jgi:hypothetical protein
MWARRLSIRREGPDRVEEKKRRRGESVGIEAIQLRNGISPVVLGRKHAPPH